jgi:hypothetical protein
MKGKLQVLHDIGQIPITRNVKLTPRKLVFQKEHRPTHQPTYYTYSREKEEHQKKRNTEPDAFDHG